MKLLDPASVARKHFAARIMPDKKISMTSAVTIVLRVTEQGWNSAMIKAEQVPFEPLGIILPNTTTCNSLRPIRLLNSQIACNISYTQVLVLALQTKIMKLQNHLNPFH